MKKKRRTIELAPQTAEMFARCVAVLKPPPELTLSQWADTYRMLSAENSATPGRWHTDNAPYQREIMDAIGDQHVRKVVVMSAAQIGKTAMLMNMLGYYMHYYASPIDHYVKDVRGIHGYGRYMDDGYVISNSLEELEDIKRNLYRLAEALGIAMSDKKNIITPFRHHSFTFLKMRVTLTETGKVVMKLSRKSIRAMRRKMDIFRRWMDEGRMGPEDVFQSYQSWRAHAKRCNSYDTLRAMDERFTRMFAEELAGRRKPFPCTMKATRTGCGWIYRRHGAVIEEEMCA